MRGSLRRLGYGLLAAFTVVAAALAYWVMVQGGALVAREDNPRRVLYEQRLRRGTIVDRSGEPLARSVVDPETGIATRLYPHPEAAPVVGYASLRYGVSGIEAAYDDLLRGDVLIAPEQQFIQNLLHRTPEGGDVQLTLDLAVQQAAVEALDGRAGAAVALGVPDGDVLALASAPTFNPNALDETWEELAADPDAPLLNRATQGLYQPGTILESVILGAGLNTGEASPDNEWAGVAQARVNGSTLPCAGDAADIGTIGAAYVAACPRPFVMVAQDIGAERLDAALDDFGLLEPPPFTLPTGAADLDTPLAEGDLAATAIGQSGLMVSPLQMARVAAAFADSGRMPPLQIVSATRTPPGEWQAVAPEGNPRGTISPASVETVVEWMGQAVEAGPASAAALPGERVYGHAGLALSGPEGTLNAWFIGFAYETSERSIAVAVLLEDTTNAREAARVGGAVLEAALAAERGG
jgi:peptidoglycan glycosyltransferase